MENHVCVFVGEVFLWAQAEEVEAVVEVENYKIREGTKDGCTGFLECNWSL